MKTQNIRRFQRRFVTIPLYIILLVVSVAFRASGQTAVEKIAIEQGLLNNYVTCVFQDSKGFIWIGTKEGVGKFDGVVFRNFTHNPEDPTSLIGSEVWDIAEDRSGNIWVGTNEGLNLLNRDQDQFRHFQLGSGDDPKGNLVSRILVDKSGSLWVGNGSGNLFLFDPESQGFLKFPTAGMAEVRDIAETSDGRLLVAYGAWVLRNKQGGIKSFDKQSREYVAFFGEAKTSGLSVTKLILRERSVYLSTYHRGIYRYDLDSRELEEVEAGNGERPELIYHMAKRTNGEIIVGTDGKGIYSLEANADRLVPIPENKDLSSQAITFVMEDKSGLTWAGTVNGGLSVLDPRKSLFENWKFTQDPKNGLSGKSVLSLAASSKGGVWIGLDHGGLNYYDPRGDKFEYFDKHGNKPADNVVNGIFEAQNGNLWLGYYQQGLGEYNTKNDVFKNYSNSEWLYQDGYVKAFFEDQEGTIWVATRNQGLIYQNFKTGARGKYKHDPSEPASLPHNHVTQIIPKDSSHLWIATFNGFSLLDKKTGQMTNYTHSPTDRNSLVGSRVYSLCKDRQENLWIATDKGLDYFDVETERFTHYNVSHGLPSNTIKGVIFDGNQDLWISSNRGISRLSTASMEIVNYSYEDGINGIEFNENSLAIDRNGKLYFGGVYGVTAFHPDSLKTNSYSPPVYITDIYLHNRPLKSYQKDGLLSRPAIETEELELKHFQSDISFDFIALNYTSAEKNSYAYYLEGYDDDWNYVGNVRSARYTNLAPGDYTFYVKASNNDGLWNDVPAKISMRILSPWWKTWWAYALYFLAIVLSIFGVSRASLNRLKLLNDLKLERMEKQNQENLYRLKLDLFTTISHEFRTPLSLIIGPIENLIENYRLDKDGNHYLRIVHQSAARLKKLADQLLDFRKSEDGTISLIPSKVDIVSFLSKRIEQFEYLAKDNDIEICSLFETSYQEMCFDEDKMDIVIYNLLSNAFKFTKPGGKVSIGLKVLTDSNSIEIQVKDNGIGITEEDQKRIFDAYYQSNHNKPGTGIGLSIARTYVRLHGGEVSLKSKPGLGSIFYVTIPMASSEELVSNQALRMAQPKKVLKYYDRGEVQFSSSKDKVLIVEDDPQMQTFLEQSLEKYFQVKTANNGVEGKLIADTWQPNLIVTDIMMPEMDGLSLCRLLKQNFSTSHIPIILLSAKTNESTLQDGYELGADDYILKPFSPKVLRTRIRTIISDRERLKRLFSEPRDEAQPVFGLTELDSSFLDTANQIIENNLSNPEFDVNSLVKELGMSRSQVFRKIKGITGQSPHQFLQTSKLNKAAKLLTRSGLNVSEVAYELGFGSVRNFRIAFKKQFDTSPTEYVRNSK